MKTMFCVFIAALALIAADSTVSNSFGKDATDPWPMEEGWEAAYEMDGGNRSIHSRLTSVRKTYEGQVYEFVNTHWGRTISHLSFTYLKDLEGDIYYMETRNLATGERYWYDPPVLYLDLPLSPGKSWEAKSNHHNSGDPDGPGEPEHHRFRVEAKLVDTPLGQFETLKMIDEPMAGYSMGGDYYLPGFGPVAFESDADGLIHRMTGNSEVGWNSRQGWGEDVKFKFGWKPQMAWTVDRTTYIRQESDDNADTTRGRIQYSISVEKIPTDLIIARGNFIVPGLPDESMLDNNVSGLLALISQVKTHIVVGSDGVFQTLASRETHQESAQAIIDSILRMEGSGDVEGLQRILAPYVKMLDTDYLEQIALAEWNNLVGTWAGYQTEIGRIMEINYPYTLPRFPDRTINFVALLMVTGRCPCEEGDIDFNCIETIVTSYSLPEEGVDHITMHHSVYLVLEPGGMFPHAMETYKNLEIKGDPDYGNLSEAGYEKFRFKYSGAKLDK